MDNSALMDDSSQDKKQGFLEIIEFSLLRIDQNGKEMMGLYGINVAKVREVVRMPSINPLVSRDNAVAGVFALRGVPIPAVHLARVLGDKNAQASVRDQIIITEFSQKRAGFIVNGTRRIRRVAWSKVLPPSSDAQSFMSGMILLEDRSFLFILDLESIIYHLEGGPAYGSITEDMPVPTRVPAHRAPPGRDAPGILLVDDSPLILNNVSRLLMTHGYRVITANNGQAALERLSAIVESPKTNSFGSVSIVLTDVEMPIMDGLSLTAHIRKHELLKNLPVILHSSLSGAATQSAGIAAGASDYVVKSDINALLEAIDATLKRDKVAVGA